MDYNFKSRDEIDEKYKWDLNSVFENEDLLQNAMDEADKTIEELVLYKGKLMDSDRSLLSFLQKEDELGKLLVKISAYVSNRFNEDNGSPKYQALYEKMAALFNRAGSSLSFVNPELLASDESLLQEYMKNEDLKMYEESISNIIRFRAHTLSAKEEKLISEFSPALDAGSKSFSMLTVADMKFPSVNIDGKEIEITQGNFVPLLESQKRENKKEIYEKFYGVFKGHINTLASTLDANTKTNSIKARVKNFSSAREAALFDNHVPVEVYDSLTKTVDSYLPSLHRYMEIRKKALGLDKMYMYDIYSSLVEDCDMKFSFEEAQELILEALKPLGEDYIKTLKHGFENRWCDVFETPGKRGGAYSSGGYGTNPFILLNYHGTLDDVFTVAHEFGHSMHTYNSCKYQPYVYSNYSIFVAEVASTLNESLLTYYLLDKWKEPKLRKYIINHFLDTIRGTLFRQTQFAIYEKLIYDEYEKGGALTAEFLSDEYDKLNQRFYGNAVEKDDFIKYEWARIPHFYYNFYVYQYATGISAALSFANRILNGGEKERDMYLGFLQSGSSLPPIEVLKRAGVDMTSSKPIEDALDIFEKFLDDFEELI